MSKPKKARGSVKPAPAQLGKQKPDLFTDRGYRLPSELQGFLEHKALQQGLSTSDLLRQYLNLFDYSGDTIPCCLNIPKRLTGQELDSWLVNAVNLIKERIG